MLRVTKEHFCETILKLSHRSRRCHLKVFLFLALVVILFSGVDNFSYFGKRPSKEHFCENILKSNNWPRKSHLKFFSIFSSGGHFVQWSGTILAILVESHPKNIPVILF